EVRGGPVSLLTGVFFHDVHPFFRGVSSSCPSNSSCSSNCLSSCDFSVGALPAAPPGEIRQREHVQACEHEQRERGQGRVGRPWGGQRTAALCQGDEVGDDRHRKSNGQPPVGLANPFVPFQGDLLS